MHNSGTNGSCEITIRWNGADNKIDRLSALLREFAQEENLSVHMTVRRPSRLTIRYNGKVFCCNAEALRYVTSDGHYCICHLTKGEARLRISFRELAGQLAAVSPTDYPVISRGILVHRSHVTGHSHDSLCMDDGTVLPISRRGRAEILHGLQEPHPIGLSAPADPGGPAPAAPHPGNCQ